MPVWRASAGWWKERLGHPLHRRPAHRLHETAVRQRRPGNDAGNHEHLWRRQLPGTAGRHLSGQHRDHLLCAGSVFRRGGHHPHPPRAGLRAYRGSGRHADGHRGVLLVLRLTPFRPWPVKLWASVFKEHPMPAPRFDQLHRQPGPFFLALGGAGMFGANLYLYGSAGQWIGIDCGLALEPTPSGDNRVSVPSLEALRKHDIQLSALLITHGHEDHIGAIPHLLRELGCPLYTSPFTAQLIRSKLTPNLEWPALHEIRPLQPIGLGNFQAEWIPVTHSIPESHGILLQVADKRLYHSGDWKLDQQPLIGELTAEARLRAIGREGVDVLIGDSTNAPNPGASRSEAAVQDGLSDAIRSCQGRVVVTCFASNLARLHSLAEIAMDSGRHAGLLGRSLLRMHSQGRAHGYLRSRPGFIGAWELGFLPREQQLWVCTGSQGEPAAALGRLASGDHPQLTLEAGDTVLFSSRLIPGNELPLQRIREQLLG